MRKPLAENYADAKLMCEMHFQGKKINMVNFSYRNSSGYQELVEMVKIWKIGNISIWMLVIINLG